MAELGMHRIEAGMPAVSQQDREAIVEIAKRYQGPNDPEIFAFARCMRADVLRAVDCGVKGIIVEIPSSDHMLKYAYKWDAQKAIDLAIDATLCAKENGLYTVFFCIDGSRTDLDDFQAGYRTRRSCPERRNQQHGHLCQPVYKDGNRYAWRRG